MNLALILAIASLILCILFFFYFRWYIGKKLIDESLIAKHRYETQKLVADIDMVTDRDARLVEERINTLKKLLEDTDKRIAVYLRELERSHAGEALYKNLGQSLSAGQAAVPSLKPAAGASPAFPHPSPAPRPETPAPGQPAVDSGALEPKTESRQAGPGNEKQLLRIKIAELAAQGHSPPQIASRLDLSLSEIELALNLLKKR
jgi:hypothetical protein